MADNKYLDYEGLKLYDSNLKAWTKALDEPIDASFVTNNAVGALGSGTTITADMTLASLIMKMLVSVKDATLKANPSMGAIQNVSGTSSGTYEVGTTITTNLTTTYSDGTFNSYKAGSNTAMEVLQAGCTATGPTYVIKTPTDASTSYTPQGSFVLKPGTTTITGSYSYSASTTKAKKSDGSDSAINIKAGSLSKTISWAGAYYKFFGQWTYANYPGDDNIARGIFSSISASGPKTVDFTGNVVLLAVKKGSNAVTAISSANETQAYDKLSVQIADAAGNMVDYDVYKYTYAADGGLGAKVTFTY